MQKTIEELDSYINQNIQGVFGKGEIEVLRNEIQKLKPGDVYVEIGTDEGKSARVAFEYADPKVHKIWIDINDPDSISGVSLGRGKWMQQEKMVGIGIGNFFVHGDADEFIDFLTLSLHADMHKVRLVFIDGHHDYDSVKKNTLKWEEYLDTSKDINLVNEEAKWGSSDGVSHHVGAVILFHDYDHPETRKWIDEHYGDNKEVFYDKIVKVQL